MKRWGIGFIIVLLACLPIFFTRATSPDLLRDSDTKELIRVIREENNPWMWFTEDWPLRNHFYRPISTLSFEIDNRLYGDNAAGYGLTNCLLAIACVLLLFWFVREVFDNPPAATVSSVLFAFWLVPSGLPDLVATAIPWLGGAAMLCSLMPKRSLPAGIAAFLLALFAASEFTPINELHTRIIQWLPGRTASVMTVFALIALSSYARYERLSAARLSPPDPGPLDPPATKGTTVARAAKPLDKLWIIGALLGLLLALGSYEQAVMVPAALLGVAILMRMQRYRVRWGWCAAFFVLLVAYLVFRYQIIPPEASGYQKQQFRSGPELWFSLSDYAFPASRQLLQLWTTLDMGASLFLVIGTYSTILFVIANVVAIGHAKRRWLYFVAGWALSLLAYLPMAWLKPFEHYHLWPEAMRTIFVVAVLWLAGDAAIRAVSPRPLQAPERQTPAPGSLPQS